MSTLLFLHWQLCKRLWGICHSSVFHRHVYTVVLILATLEKVVRYFPFQCISQACLYCCSYTGNFVKGCEVFAIPVYFTCMCILLFLHWQLWKRLWGICHSDAFQGNTVAFVFISHLSFMWWLPNLIYILYNKWSAIRAGVHVDDCLLMHAHSCVSRLLALFVVLLC